MAVSGVMTAVATAWGVNEACLGLRWAWAALLDYLRLIWCPSGPASLRLHAGLREGEGNDDPQRDEGGSSASIWAESGSG